MSMIDHSLKIAFRRFRKNKLFALINVFGLVVGMTSFLVVLQLVRFEWNYDTFHLDAERIYRIRNDNYNGKVREEMSAGCPSALAPLLKDHIPEVEASARLLRAIRMMVSNEQDAKHFRSDDVYFADSSFTSVFSFPIVSGQELRALVEPNTAVITEGLARKVYGKGNPMGKKLRFHSRYFDMDCQVVAVLKDMPVNSTIKFDALISMATYEKQKMTYGNLNSWIPMFFTYVKLKNRAAPQTVEARLAEIVTKHTENPENGRHSVFALEKLKDIHLNNNKVLLYEEPTIGRQTVYLLLIIAFVIMGIAWVNYLNLSTAKVLDRVKEVGICKVAGARKVDFIGPFFLESFLYNIASVVVSLVCLLVFRETIHQMFDKPLDLNMLGNVTNILIVLGLLVFGTTISGVYPTFVLSAYNPVNALKGKVVAQTGLLDFRKGLVLFQFTASIFLIAGVLTIFQQVKYMRNMKLGMDADQLLVVRAPVESSDSLLVSKMAYLKERVKQYREISGVTGSYYIPGKEIRFRDRIKTTQNSTNPVIFGVLSGDIDLVPTFGFKIIGGRTFSKTNGGDENAVVLNATGVRALGFRSSEAAINQTVYFYDNVPKKVIGVIADYHQLSAKENYEPTVILYSKEAMNFYAFHVRSFNVSSSLGKIRALWKEVFPSDPFDYVFLDAFFDQQYQTEVRFTNLFAFFTFIAIFIACLGLFGLSYHSMKIRTKEVGVRKTLGASMWEIAVLLGRDTMLLILVSSMIALPCFSYFTSKWLSNYAFSIKIDWWFFAVPMLLLFVIAFGTIGFLLLKSARLNPAKALKYE